MPNNDTTETTAPTDRVRYIVGPDPTWTSIAGGSVACQDVREGDVVTKDYEYGDGDWNVIRETDGSGGPVHPRHLTPVDEPPAPAVAPSAVLLSDGTPRYMLIPTSNGVVAALANPGHLAWSVIDRASTLGPTVIANFRGYADAHTYLTSLDK